MGVLNKPYYTVKFDGYQVDELNGL